MDNYSSILKAVQEFDEMFYEKVTKGLFQKEVSPEPTIQSTLAMLEEFKENRDFGLISDYVKKANNRKKTVNRKQSKENVNPNVDVTNSNLNKIPYVKMERISEEAMSNIKDSMKKYKKRVVKMEPKSSYVNNDVEIIDNVETHSISDDSSDVDDIMEKQKNTVVAATENVKSTRMLSKMLPPTAEVKRTTRTKTKADTEEVNIRSTRSKTRNKNTNLEILSNSESAKSIRKKQMKEKISSEDVKSQTKESKRSRSQSPCEPQRYLKKLKTSKHDDTSIYEDAVDDSEIIKEASYHQSPVKKRVAAYEKMTETPPMRITRTKTKMLAAKNEEVVTPISNRLVTPSKMSTMKNMIVTGTETRTLKALKSSQKMFKEREKLRLQKEADLALRKDELVLEKMRKIEQEKRRLQRLEERKLQKKHEEELKRKEQEIKRKMAEEERRRKEVERQRLEEERRLKEEEEQRLKEEERCRKEEERKRAKAQKAKKKPKNDIYMQEEAPLLPTYDCYDSDDAESLLAKRVAPQWLNREELSNTLNIMESFIKPKVINTLFCPMPQTPNLLDIFDNVNPIRLKRNSSAIWSKPPRFTMMPINISNI